MYNVIFESDNGQKYVFGKSGNTVFDMDLGSGVSVKLGTSQGFSQIGETVQSKNVSGRNINVTGCVFGNVPERKATMRRVISPFAWGRLVFEKKYYTRVCVSNPPSFSTAKNDGRFKMRFFAPYPFFFETNETSSEIGSIKPLFSFPVNYSTPHKFGEKSSEKYKNIVNSGDARIPFSLYLHTSGTSTNIVLSNLTTFQNLKINGKLLAGDYINIYRNSDNVLKAELTSNGTTTDIISWIDESSDLFELETGDNLIAVNDDEGGVSLDAKISFNSAVVALYEY